MTDNIEITADITTNDEYNAEVSSDSSNVNAEVITSAGYDKNFVFIQAIASDTWNIQHSLNKYCSVTVVDSANNVVVGDIQYTDKNNVVISFSAAFTGKAYCN